MRSKGSPEVIANLWATLPGSIDNPNSPRGFVHAAGFSQFFESLASDRGHL